MRDGRAVEEIQLFPDLQRQDPSTGTAMAFPLAGALNDLNNHSLAVRQVPRGPRRIPGMLAQAWRGLDPSLEPGIIDPDLSGLDRVANL